MLPLCSPSASFQVAAISWKGAYTIVWLVISVTATQVTLLGHLALLASRIYTCGLYILVYFKSCCLKVWLLISLNLDAD